MTTQELRARVQGILRSRYPDYMNKKPGERVLLAMSVLANDLRVREIGGNNKGPMVEAIIGSTGLAAKGGYAWCAASVEFAAECANVSLGPPDPKSASVAAWRTWASGQGRLLHVPARGRLATLLNADGTGHMGIVADVRADGRLRTYEGNTSSGDAGSQRDGGGLYERIRPNGYFSRFITLD